MRSSLQRGFARSRWSWFTPTPTNPDWDWNHFKFQCNAGEYIAGVSHSTSTSALHTVMCCPGKVEPVVRCQTAVVATAADGTYWDWNPNFPKATCAAGAFVRGVSRSPATGRIHAVRCCKPAP